MQKVFFAHKKSGAKRDLLNHEKFILDTPATDHGDDRF